MALLERVCEKLENATKPLRLIDLAFEFGIAPHHLQRLFSRAYGASPRKYQERFRLARAVAMLRRGVGVSDVAAELEFAEVSSFSRSFVRAYGSRPSAFRKN